MKLLCHLHTGLGSFLDISVPLQDISRLTKMEKQRVNIKLCFMLNKNATKTYNLLQQANSDTELVMLTYI